MEQENKNAVNNDLENVMDACGLTENYSETDSKVGKFIMLGIGACVVGTVVSIILHKNKGKIYDHLAKKLEKQGYLIVGPNESHVQNTAEESLDELLSSNNN